MTRRLRRITTPLLVAVILCAGAVGAALAQSRNSSALTGRVLDDKGAPLAGATVEIESPGLIGGVRGVVTDASGKYRFPEIASGTYTITVSMTGFKKVRREEVRLPLGQTIDLPINLYPSTGDETVTVVGEAPTIDKTSSAASTVLPREYLDNIPTTRFQPDTLNLAPGINLDAAYGGGARPRTPGRSTASTLPIPRADRRGRSSTTTSSTRFSSSGSGRPRSTGDSPASFSTARRSPGATSSAASWTATSATRA